MKKLGLIAMAVAMLAMVGCKKENSGSVTVNSVTLNKTSITLTVGGSDVLKATTDPAGQAVSWKSSNTAVATVAGGVVNAVGEGTATITATAGDKTATCQVTVSNNALYDLFNIAGFGLFGSEFEFIPGTETELELSIGTVKCQLAYIHWYGWDGDLIYTQETSWAGDGLFIIGGKVPVYVIIAGEYKDYYIGSMYWTVGREENDEDIVPYNMIAGAVDPETYGDWVSYLFGDSCDHEIDQEVIWANTHEACFTYWSVTEDFSYGDYGLYYGFINEMIYRQEDEEEEIESAWYAQIDWADLTSDDRQFGFQFDLEHYNQTYVEGEGGELLFTRPYDYAQVAKTLGDPTLVDEFEEYISGEDEAKYYVAGKLSDLEMPIVRGKALDKDKLHMAR